MIGSIGQAIAVLLIAGYTLYKEFRERARIKAYDLARNPERCVEHRDAINRLRSDLNQIRDDIRRIKEKLEIV